jgi:Transposase DDE domain
VSNAIWRKRIGEGSSKKCHTVTILNVLADDNNYEVLRALVERSALPLSERETHFASDSTKFSPSRKAHWADSKTGKEGLQQDWVKCHMMVGVDSHIVTAIEIREQNASDAKTFKALFDTTSKNFDIVAISADKGYCSQENYDIVGRNGATPYIAFLSHVKATTGNKHWKESFNRFKVTRRNIRTAITNDPTPNLPSAQ